jgi:hypothetical protein
VDPNDRRSSRDWTWPAEHKPSSYDRVSDRTKRAAKLAERLEERNYTRTTVGSDGHLAFTYHKHLPHNPELFGRVLAEVENDEPRRLYAAWIRSMDDLRAAEAADFIEGQLLIARAFRENPRADVTNQLAERSFESPESYPDWWRYPSGDNRGLAGALSANLEVLVDEGLIADLRWYRGFVEHVTVKAHRFVEIADELFSLAPIRHLTITCAKGLDHQDLGVWKALLASPHLARMRSLRFPARNVDHPLAELNRLTDSDIELLADSPNVRGVRYLEFTDARALTIRAFDALARSRNLPELSAVRHDLYRYEQLGDFGFARVGPHQQIPERSPLVGWRGALEKAHGPLPWLHVAENYGSETPDLEAVVEHPVKRTS